MKRKTRLTFFVTLFAIISLCFIATGCISFDGGQLKSDYGVIVKGGNFDENCTLVTEVIDATSEVGKQTLDLIKGKEYDAEKPVYIFDISVVILSIVF